MAAVRRRWKATDLRTKLIVLFAVFAITPLTAFGVVAYWKTSELVVQQVEQVISENLTQLNHGLDYFIDDVEQLSMYIYTNSTIQSILAKDPLRSREERYRDRKVMEGLLASFLGLKSWDIDIYLLGDNGDAYFTGELLPRRYEQYDVNWGLFRKAKEADGDIVWDTHYWTNRIDDHGAVLSSGRRLKNTQTNEPIGFLVIDVNEPALATMYSKARLLPGSEIVLTDRAGYIISSAPSKHRVGTKLEGDYVERVLDGRRGSFQMPAKPAAASQGREGAGEPARLVIYDTSEVTGFKLINVVLLDALAHDRGAMRRLVLTALGVFVALSVGLAFFLSTSMTRPIDRLRATMREAEAGNLHAAFSVESQDEIGQLGAGFNRMLARLRQLIAQVYEKQDQLRQAELKAIQAQFNPHFLYNALDSINWMARIHRVDEISRTAVALGELLRFSIRNDVEMIPVRDEMRLIKSYLTVQHMRNRDKFETIVEVDPEIEGYYIPKLLLQPVVENAVIHGLERKASKGTLRVTGKKADGRLIFTVEDDGVGFSETNHSGAGQAEMYGAMPDSNDATPEHGAKEGGGNGTPARAGRGDTTGIGLANIRRRLELHFGSNHAFSIVSEPGKGTKVEIHIPMVTEAEASRVYAFPRR